LRSLVLHNETVALGDELNAATSRVESDDGSHYYDHWLAALEHLVMAKGLADSAALAARKEAWADAYRCTPHGMPVKLATNSDDSSQKPHLGSRVERPRPL
jgi:nitrile hydratase beta subunit-like protein